MYTPPPRDVSGQAPDRICEIDIGETQLKIQSVEKSLMHLLQLNSEARCLKSQDIKLQGPSTVTILQMSDQRKHLLP